MFEKLVAKNLIVPSLAASGDDEIWMALALEQAECAAKIGEVPVGCVLVDVGGIELSRAHNARETKSDPTAHAEMIALQLAAARRNSWRLDGVTVYTTLEPCVMCAGAMIQSRIRRVVYGCTDPKGGALTSLFSIGQDARLNHRFEVVGGVLATTCAAQLQTFFSDLRAQGKK